MKIFFFSILALLCSIVNVDAQLKSSNGHFLVERDLFTPPENDLLNEFVGKKAPNFMANDQYDKSIALSNFKGQNVILGFWSIENSESESMVKFLDLLAQDKAAKVIGYVYEDKAAMMDYLRQRPVSFSVMPQGKFISEINYAHDLGDPRMFFIDATGIIKEILPASFFQKTADPYPVILDIIELAF